MQDSGARLAGVAGLLRRLRRQLSGAIAWRQAGFALAVIAGAIWFAIIWDRSFEPSTTARFVVECLLAVGGVVWLAWAVFPVWWRGVADREAVELLHAVRPREAGLIATAMDIGSAERSANPDLCDATLRSADRVANSLADVRLVRPATSYGLAWFAAVALGGAAFGGLARPDLAEAFARRVALSDAPWPRRVTLEAEGFYRDAATGEWVRYTPRGEPAEVVVVASVAAGKSPPANVWSRRLTDRSSLESLVRVGEPAGEGPVSQRYRRRFDRVDDDIRLAIRGGDGRIRLRLAAADRPRLRDVSIECEPPAYLGAPTRSHALATLDRLAVGSRLAIRGVGSQTLAGLEATLTSDDGPTQSVPVSLDDAGRSFLIELPPLLTSGAVAVTAIDSWGLASERLDVALAVAPDRSPTVSLKPDGIGRAVTRDARLPALVRVDDDHAVASVSLVLIQDERRVANELAPPIDLPGETRGVIDLLSLRSGGEGERFVADPGDRLSFRATAGDCFDLGPRSPTESAAIELEVVTPSELLARLGDAQRELSRSVEALLADVERLQYAVDLLSRRLDEANAAASAAELKRWSAERRLDASKAINGVRDAADRADSLRRQVENNRLDQPALIDRLATAVVAPLRAAHRTDLAAGRRALEGLTESVARENLASASDATTRAAAKLRGVAASLDSQQTYNDVVTLLRGLIRDQRRVNERTSRQKAQSVRGLFD